MNRQTDPHPEDIPANLAAAREEIAAIDRMLSNSGIDKDYPTDNIDAVLYAEGDYKESEAVATLIAEGWVWDGDQWVLPKAIDKAKETRDQQKENE